MRKLKTKDLFALSKIYSKMGIEIDNEMAKTDDVSIFGAQMINKIMSNLHKADTEIYEFLAKLNNMTSSEIEESELVDLKKMIEEIFQDEAVKSFFK